MNIDFKIESELQNNSLLKEMSELYSNHYGLWGRTSKNYGKRISLNESRISKWVSFDNTYIATARVNNVLVGYAIAVVASKNKSEQSDKSKMISWVTQLVVHENYRLKGIAKTLLFSFWGFSNYYAWGILSSNPYAIRALESATKRRAIPLKIRNRSRKLISFGIDNINYISDKTEFVITASTSKANTFFPSDISNIEKKLLDVQQNEDVWTMGKIDEGWEWFAFTFNDQERIQLSAQDIDDLLNSSEIMAQKAYSRMLMDNKQHAWSNHTDVEVDFIIKHCKLLKGHSILDFGCGMGRHSIALGKKNFNVTGVDYVNELLTKANEKAIEAEISVTFLEEDCRSVSIEKTYDLVLCLYDVIGSFIDSDDNLKIIKNMYEHTKKEGYALISVMNYELTDSMAKYKFSFHEHPDKVFDIPASDIMEKTGNIFDPEHYMIDEDTHIVYRREQFISGDNLPTELIVRDVRYTKNEICKICEDCGFKIIFYRYVQAGKWESELEATDSKAKEILVFCQKN